MDFIGHHALANHCYNCGVFTVDTFTHYTPVCILSEVNPFSITNTRVIIIPTTITTSYSYYTATSGPILAIIVVQLRIGLYIYSGGGSSMTSGPPEGVSWSGSHAGHRHACPWRICLCARTGLHRTNPQSCAPCTVCRPPRGICCILLSQQSQVSDCRTTRSSGSTLHRSAKNTHPSIM
jgi:hypothetical protein